ncbi:MAG: class B sortase [Butyrivibrio sp.]|nr:class B sortase [Butyrivibrio sp.]
MKLVQNRVFRLIVILICIGIIIYESISLYNENEEYEIADTEYEEIVENSVTVTDTTELPPGATYPPLQINFDQLKGINKDFVGWLYMPCFDLNYPVVHENEIDEYIKKTFEGKYNSSGCLFTDVLSTVDFTGMHDIIFGHNMRNGSMFGQFKKLIQDDGKDIINSNPYVYIYTENAVYKYKIFAYYVTPVGSDAYSVVTSEQEYNDFLKFISSNNLYEKPADLDMSTYPSILTLSTCNGRTGSGKRLVIHSAKVESWTIN